MKHILAVVTGSEHDTGVLDAALAVARLFGGRVEALHPRYDSRAILPVIGDGMVGLPYADLSATFEAQGNSRAERARRSFDEWSRRAGSEAAGAAWKEQVGVPTTLVTGRGRQSDLIVLARPGGAEHDTDLLTESALFDSGRPVLCVPPGGVPDIGPTAAVLWDDSAEAARAVGDAMPLLGKMASTVVVTMPEGGRSEAQMAELESFAGSLGARGLNVSHTRIERRRDAGEALLGAARDAGASVIVMGAYGHSRLRELVLGGVTRYMLSHAPLPLFMAH